MLAQIASWLRSLRTAHAERLIHERQVVVTTTDKGIAALFPSSGKIQSIEWSAIDSIAVETNDSGPWGADVWWLLEGAGTACSFPQGATGEAEALSEIQHRFPAFRPKGMNSTENARFVCWERKHAR